MTFSLRLFSVELEPRVLIATCLRVQNQPQMLKTTLIVEKSLKTVMVITCQGQGVNMPRCARRVSESGYYHVMLRGNGRQVIFEDDADRRAFLEVLSEAMSSRAIEIVAWCLMSNHVHLLLTDANARLSDAIHAITTSYAGHFNRRFDHVGSVFAGRFKSVPVEDDAQLVAAVRYIHDNPVKAGICAAPDEYPWSSYHEYVGEPWITSVEIVLDLLGGVDQFELFSLAPRPTGYCFMSGARVPEEDSADVARAAIYPLALADVKTVEGRERVRTLSLMRDAGLSVRQIERLTGVGRYAIEKSLLLARSG